MAAATMVASLASGLASGLWRLGSWKGLELSGLHLPSAECSLLRMRMRQD